MYRQGAGDLSPAPTKKKMFSAGEPSLIFLFLFFREFP